MTITRTRPGKAVPLAGHNTKSSKKNRDQTTTFPLSVGFRFRYDNTTGKEYYTPLTLADLLNPTENKDGVFFMAEGPLHDLMATLLAIMLRLYLNERGWLILRDVRVDWEQTALHSQHPDITAVFGGRLPPENKETYVVGRDGGTPQFLIEITSKETRQVDLKAKPLLYAAAGVKELLVIDIRTQRKQPWQLRAYELSPMPPYKHTIAPDTAFGVTFATVGLRFVPIGRERVDVYDVATGKRLLTPDELKIQAEAETTRAEELARRLHEAETLLQSLRSVSE